MAVSDNTYKVPTAPAVWKNIPEPMDWPWANVPALPPLVCADGRRTAVYPTTSRICTDLQRLYVRFECEDHDIWGHYSERDQPIYEEEVVELFLASGGADPTCYYEFEVSPNGVLFDAQIINTTPFQKDIQIHHQWDCAGIEWWAERYDVEKQWTAVLIVPWTSVAPHNTPATVWRANFCRIERPRGQEPEFTCWSPTHTDPADFHKPAHFGRLQLPF